MIRILRKHTVASGRIIRLFNICTVLLMLSCSGEDEGLLPVMPDHFEEIDFHLNDIATDLKVIPLSNDVPMLRSRHVEWYDDRFYIGDLYNNRIYRFTSDGKYIDMLDRQGRGAEEYLYIVDFFIDERTGHIYISTNIDKIVVYNQNFEFVRNIPYPQEREAALDAKWLNGSIHLFYFNYSGEGNGWVNIDTSGQIINSRQSIDKYKLPCSEFDIQIFENNGRLYRHYNLNDTIYEIDSTGYHPYCLVGRKFRDGYNLVVDERTGGRSYHKTNDPYREFRSIYGIGDYWLINYRKIFPSAEYNVIEETVLYDYKMNKSYLINSCRSERGVPVHIGPPNDWAGWGAIFPRAYLDIDNDNYILYPMDSYRFNERTLCDDFINSDPSRPEIKQRMIDIADTLTMEDNPVMVLLKLKY
jgi:hypothetical protein